MTSTESADDDERGDSIGRLNALTDGVVAIAITLLALDLKPDLPAHISSHDLAHYLHAHAADYSAFVLAFFLIAQYWVLHRKRMSRVVRSSNALVRITLVFLFGITVAPLTSSITGGQSNSLAVTLFAANVAFIGSSAGALGEVIRRQHLANYRESRHERVLRVGRSVTSVAIAVLVAGLAWVIGDHATYFYLLYLVADRPAALVWRLAERRE